MILRVRGGVVDVCVVDCVWSCSCGGFATALMSGERGGVGVGNAENL